MILCHKCSGVLNPSLDGDGNGLYGCGCISGWIRGFEPILTREQAIAAQVNACDERIALYIRQGREAWNVEQETSRRDKLAKLV